jgi:hypothetical protein
MRTQVKLAALQLVGGFIGWVWILASIAAVITLVAAVFFDAKWTSVLWAFGVAAVAKFLTRGLVETQGQVKGDAMRASAERLVNAYGAALERAGSVIASEALLPAPKDDIKGALLYAASEARASGQLKRVERLRIGYASLANFVPAAESAPVASFDEIVADAAGATGPEVVAVAEKLAALPPTTETIERTSAEYARLTKEFDDLLAKLGG